MVICQECYFHINMIAIERKTQAKNLNTMINNNINVIKIMKPERHGAQIDEA